MSGTSKTDTPSTHQGRTKGGEVSKAEHDQKPEQSVTPDSQSDHRSMKIQGVKFIAETEPFGTRQSWQQVRLTIKGGLRPGQARANEPLETVQVDHDDLVEIEFQQGMKIWIRGEDYVRTLGTMSSRSVDAPDVYLVPSAMPFQPAGSETRGPVSWAIKSLHVLGVDLAKKSAVEIGRLVENRNPGNRPRFARCSMKTGSFATIPVTARQTDTSGPYLLFLHGTLSSTWGSFGGLWSNERKRELDGLSAKYGDRVFAFDHKTLTESPLQNATQLLDAMHRFLPQNAEVHLVSHSRGGLIGELICREGSLFEDVHAPAFFQAYRDYATLPAQVKEFQAALNARTFTVKKFVRVACPALGTTLVSDRVDRWLTVIGSVLGSAVPGTPLFDTFEDIGEFIAAVIKERTRTEALPGIEAMMPESPFVRMINWPTTTVKGDLTVIAGDVEPDKWWAKVLVWATDRFYDSDHDLVVNTPSMFGGARREGNSLLSFHKGSDVNHFHYFKNESSARALRKALTEEIQAGKDGFELLTPPTVPIARGKKPAPPPPANPLGIVFVLPGIMGSELKEGDDRVWLDVPDLMFGGFRQLDIDRKGITASGVLSKYYDDLIEYLADTHIVVPFPYDWRLSVEDESRRFLETVRTEMTKHDTSLPVRILAHSMGGLIAKGMIVLDPENWKTLTSERSARLVMLGTPNRGSHSITELLVGQSSTLRMIATLDLAHNQEELLGFISRFPGVLALLPDDSDAAYFDVDTWHRYADAAGKGWKVPLQEDLARELAFRRRMDTVHFDSNSTVYVAGLADATLTGMELHTEAEAPDERISFLCTRRGDGKVPWATGIPAGVPVFYMDAEHGDLPSDKDNFKALGELITKGDTLALSRVAPVARSAMETFVRPREVQALFPDQQTLESAIMGKKGKRRQKIGRDGTQVQVAVVHGNLAFAAFPVLIGHYQGDPIISAERFLDHELRNALSNHHKMNLYPGPLLSSAIFSNPDLCTNAEVNLKGAIVVGLGAAGRLNASTLSRTITQAVRRYVLEWPYPDRQSSTTGVVTFGISSLLIGTTDGGISVRDAMVATIKGVINANQALADASLNYRVTRLEFTELWEDRAVEAAKELTGIMEESDFRSRLDATPTLLKRKGAMQRIYSSAPSEWWQRLQILGRSEASEPGKRTLRFSSLTQRARSEVRILSPQRALIDDFVRSTITTTRSDMAAAKTLFELLLPNELKEQARDQDDLMLILDDEAAQYPWELLQDPLDSTGRPFAVTNGMLRQLESKDFRSDVREVLEYNALIIGDPISSFAPLPGARKEAEVVQKLLLQSRFDTVECLTQPDTAQVMNAFFARSYRVLHLAGHGEYEPGDGDDGMEGGRKPRAGMIIGDEARITPNEVRQMRMVPELVFVNCCHLGRIEDVPEQIAKNNRRSDYNRIAANLATEFIHIGVRAIIAAGWAVDDDAAALFSKTFYQEMINGNTFGNAVRLARSLVFETFPGSNTWGAYQCYGDPDYRFWKAASGDTSELPRNFVSPEEFVSEINILTGRIALSGGRNDTDNRMKLAQMEKAIPTEWDADGRIRIALARAYAEAGDFSLAVERYAEASTSEDGAMTLKDIEQWANLESRQMLRTVRLSDKKSSPSSKDTEAVFKKCIERLSALETTTERLNLLGSVCKRMAWAQALQRRNPTSALAQMSAMYTLAFDNGEKQGNFDLYAFNNMQTARILHALQTPSKKSVWSDIRNEFQRHEKEIQDATKEKSDFWSAVKIIDTELFKAIAHDPASGAGVLALEERYLEAKKLASIREFESVVDQLEFFEQVGNPSTELSKVLNTLIRALTTDPSSPSAMP